MPPATGICLAMLIRTRGAMPACSASRIAARPARFPAPAGTSSASGPVVVTLNSSAGAMVTSSYRFTAWNTVTSEW